MQPVKMDLHLLRSCLILFLASTAFGTELANMCDLLLCENGGMCITDGDDGYCHCLPGYSGYRCENDMNLCEPNPCLNSGTCILEEYGRSRRCLCRPGFFDENCERGPCGKECSQKYQPVCGSDGYTYQNGCELEKASCQDNTLICASLGECPANGCRCKCTPNKDPVCGTDCITYDNECELNNARKCSNPSLRKSYHGDCRAFTCALRKPYKCNTCLRLTGPVCGSDKKVYSSECQLRVKACKRKDLRLAPCPEEVTVNNETHCNRPKETEGMLVFVSSGITINQVRKVTNGAEVEFTCVDEYSLHGESLLTCNNGDFDHKIPKCYRTCDEDPVINGKAIGSFEHKTTVRFHCNNGYTLEGPQTLTCIDGQYDDNLPICQADCQSPPLVLNGIYNGTTNHGGVIRYMCFDGFKLVGNEYLNCFNGIFLEEPPRCLADCPEPRTPLAGFRYQSSNRHGGIIHFGCASNFTLIGSEFLLCENGLWNASVPQCSPCSDGATYFNGSCYTLQYRRHYYDIAEERCEERGGHLATFTTHQELMAINNTQALNGLRFYIGVKARIDKWGRETNENSDYFNWPDHNCAYHTTGVINRWDNLLPCTDRKQFICETPKACFRDIRCLAKSIQYNGHCYQVHDIYTETWSDAQKYCQNLEGYLVVISDIKEQEAVNSLLSECGPFPENQFWLGLSRESTESEWTWVLPSVAYDFKYWPDFRCAYILSQDASLPWHHSTCDDFPFSSICQTSAALYDDIPNPCDSNPCINGGKCFSKVTEDFSDYHCHCPTGFDGKNCDTEGTCDGFRCDNKKCIQCIFTCDTINNCGDNSDERCSGRLTKCSDTP